MTSHDAKINLPTLRDADHYDDWKYKVVAFLVTLRLYQPIAEGRAPLQLQDIHDDAATANLQRARDALATKQRAERAVGQHGGPQSTDPLPCELLAPVEQQYRPETQAEYNSRNAAWLETNRNLWAAIVRSLEGEPLTVSKRVGAGDGLALWQELEQRYESSSVTTQLTQIARLLSMKIE